MQKIQLIKKNELTGHKGPIYSFAYNNHKLYSCSNDSLIVEWDLNVPEQPKAICKIPSKAFTMVFHATQNHLIIGTFQGMLRIVDLGKNKEIRCIDFQQGIIYKVVNDLNFNRILVLTEKGVLTVLDSKTYDTLEKIQICKHKLRAIHQSKDHTHYLIGAGNGSIYKVNTETFIIEQELKDHLIDFGVNTILRVEDNIISGSRDAHLVARNTFYLDKNILKIPAHNYAIYDLALSPNEKYFASCSRDKTIKIWDCHSLKLLKRIDLKLNKGHSHSVNCLLWNKEGLISGSDDGKIMIWDVS